MTTSDSTTTSIIQKQSMILAMSRDSHFFVVGAGRSGTTLLRNMLSAHSRLAVTPETYFMKRAELEGLYERAGPDFDCMWERLIDWVRFKDLGIDAAECRARIEASSDFSFRSIFDTMLTMYGELVGKPRVGEKSPSHTRYLDTLFQWFPDARAIALQRDPRAVVASRLKTPWGKQRITPRSLKNGIFLHNRLNAITSFAKVWHQVYADILPLWRDDPRVRVIKYEDLVADPERITRSICDFLGEEFEPQMLTDRSNAETPRAKGTMKDAELDQWRKVHEAQSARPLSTSSVEKWRDQLSAAEVGLIEARCVEPMRMAGYPLSSRTFARNIFDTATRFHNGLGRIEIRIAARLGV